MKSANDIRRLALADQEAEIDPGRPEGDQLDIHLQFTQHIEDLGGEPDTIPDIFTNDTDLLPVMVDIHPAELLELADSGVELPPTLGLCFATLV